MEDFLYNITSGDWATQLDWQSVLTVLVSATVIGFIISLVYLFTHKNEGYSQAFCVSLILLSPIVGMVILVIGNNVATAFSLAGAFALVRFRSVAGSAKEIVCIFLAMATGLATAMGYIGLAAVFVVIFCAAMIIASFIRFKEKDDLVRELRITVPEDLNYAHSFDDVFDKYTKASKLQNVKTTNMGSLYKLSYNIELRSEDDIQDFIDELRCRNGNLEISVMIPATAETTL